MKQIYYCNFCCSTGKNFQKWLNGEVEIITAKEFMIGIKCQNPKKEEHQRLTLKTCFG